LERREQNKETYNPTTVTNPTTEMNGDIPKISSSLVLAGSIAILLDVPEER
jgi:hypothetical protein